jgi:diaminopimelate decarboxylase
MSKAAPFATAPTARRLPLEHWGFRAGVDGLELEGVPIVDLVRRLDRAFYLFSEARLRRNARAALAAVADQLPGGDVLYALKANGHPRVIEILREEGLGAEVVSSRELATAGQAGFPGARTVMNGPGKTDSALRDAVGRGVLIQVDSASEAEALARVATALGRTARAGLRVSGSFFGAEAPTAGAAFGLDPSGPGFREALEALRASPLVRIESLSAHIGTGVVSAEPYGVLARGLAALRRSLRAEGIDVSTLDLGGGFAVRSEVRYPEAVFDTLAAGWPVPVPAPEEIVEFGGVVAAIRAELVTHPPARVILEPGRLLVSDAFHLVARVVRLKEEAGVRYAVLEASRVQNALFVGRGWHEIVHAGRPLSPDQGGYTLVGPLPAAFDTFAHARPLPRLAEGEALVICDVGAYNLSAQSGWCFDPVPVVSAVDGRACLYEGAGPPREV